MQETRVSRIRYGAKPIVETEAGKVIANKVVLAGNAYLRDAEPKLQNAVFSTGTYMIATEPLDEERAHELLG